MILVTGAAGKSGQALIGALAARDAAVRAFVRHPAQVALLQQIGATEIVVGNLRNAADVHRACQAVDAIYHICPNMQPDEFAIAQQLIAAAQTAGVNRIIYHSVLHPQTVAMPHHWQKLRVEELLFTAALDYTILQPAAYMQNVLASWPLIKTEGIYQIPYATTTVLGMVDLHDVAEAAARVLTTPGHRGATYELANDEWLTQDAVAAILSEELERPVRAIAQPRAQWQQQARTAGLSDYAVDTLLKMFDYYERFGFGGNGNALTWLLGRRPTSFANWLRTHIAEEYSRGNN